MTANYRPRLRTAVRRVYYPVAVILAAVAWIGGWALNRYIVDHVVIADVAAYEIETLGTSTTVQGAIDAAPAAPVVTEDSYRADETQISIRRVASGSGSDALVYFVADVSLAHATTLRSAFAGNKFGNNIVAETSTIAEESNAIFAINGDYYGFRSSGIVVRNGVVYRDKGARPGLAIYRDGRAAIYDETSTTGEQLVAAGVMHTLSFGPGLVNGGEIVEGIDKVQIDTNIGNRSIQGNQPRAGVGIKSPGNYVFIVVDGRSPGYSRGVTMPEFAALFKELGCTVAYNLDGGGSATMWFNGKVVNKPAGKGGERAISDIIYVAKAA